MELRRGWGEKGKKDTQVKKFISLKGIVEKAHTIPLIKGENTISVSAFNGTNTVMSAMESIKIKADILERKPQLDALIVWK